MNIPGVIKSLTEETALAKYRIVKFGTDDKSVVQAAADTDASIGVTGSVVGGVGNRTDVTLTGIAEVEYGGAVTGGDLLTSDASGKAIAVTRHDHTENTAGAYVQNATTNKGTGIRVIGVAMESGVAGDIGSCTIAPAAA